MVKNAEEARKLVKKSEKEYSLIFPRKKVVDETVENILKEVEYECRRMRTYAEYDVKVFNPRSEKMANLPTLDEFVQQDMVIIEEFEGIVSRLKSLGFVCLVDRHVQVFGSDCGLWTICIFWDKENEA